jgi:hypothetical protein
MHWPTGLYWSVFSPPDVNVHLLSLFQVAWTIT